MTRKGRSLMLIALLALLGTLTACGPKQSEIAAAAAPEQSSTAAPGVTDEEVKVGFIVIDQTRLQATLGFESPDSGDVEGQIQTLADHVNSEGGIGGRALVPVIRVYDALTDSAVNEEKLCRSFTEDEVQKLDAMGYVGDDEHGDEASEPNPPH